MKKAQCLLSSFIFLVVFTIFFFVLLPYTNAAAPTISNVPETVTTDSEFTFSAGMDGLSKNTSYRLRVAVAPSGSSEYFGSTYNGSSWNKGSINDGNFLLVTTDDSGIWNGDVKGKIELSDPNFKNGAGTYELKVGRYTETGSTPTWSNSISIVVSAPPPTATPTLVPTNTPTPQNTLTPTRTPTPQNTPTPSKTPTPGPTTKVFSTSAPTTESTTISATGKLTPTRVLGMSTKSAMIILSTATPTEKPKSIVAVAGASEEVKQDFLPFFFIAGGILLMVSYAILTFQPQLKKLWEKE